MGRSISSSAIVARAPARRRHVLAGAAKAAACSLLACSPSLAIPEQAQPADSFANSMGVNIHSGPLPFSNWQLYQDNWPQVINAIKDIGFRYVRDFPYDTTDLNALTAQAGTKIDAIIEYRNPNLPNFPLDISHLNDPLNAAKQLTGLAYLEGPNEYDGSSDPDWQTTLTNWQQAFYTQAKADPILGSKPVLAPSGGQVSSLSALIPYVDLGNIHSYNDNQLPSQYVDGAYRNALPLSGPNNTIIATEAGGHTHDPPTPNTFDSPESLSGKYLPRVYFEYFNRGIPQTYLYELLDQAVDAPGTFSIENHFGLLNSDFSYKPAAYSIKDLFTLLADPNTNFTPSSLDYTITGGSDQLHHTLLQKADGTFYLALWQEVLSYDPQTTQTINNPTLPITLTLANPIPRADVYLPDTSADSTQTLTNVSQINLNVPGEIMLVRLGSASPGGGGMIFSSGVRSISSDSDFGAVPTSPTTNITFAGGTMRLGAGGFTLNANRFISVAAGGGILDTNGVDLTYGGSITGSAAFTKTGAGTLHLAQLRYDGPLSIQAGSIHLFPGNLSASVLSSVPTIAPGAQLDIEDNALIVNYAAGDTTHSTRDAIRNLLKNGRNGAAGQPGAWNGLGGIVSTFAHANGNGFNLAIGYADNADLAAVRGAGSYTSFAGQTVSSNTILVQLTRGADATMDGIVDAQDVTILGAHFMKPNSGQWCFGDFDYSGTCDSSDVTTLGSNFGRTSPALSPAQMTAEFGAAFTQAFETGQDAAVPEPAVALAATGLAGLSLLRRRRRFSS